MSIPPIHITASEESRQRVLQGLMAFQRWAQTTQNNRSIPPALVEGLRGFGLQPDLSGLHLDDAFHLVKETRHDSSRAVQIFDFNVPHDNSDTIRVRYVRKSDNDRHTLDIRTGEVHSTCGHWMSGDTEYRSVMETIPDGPQGNSARNLLHQHWIAPRNWCQRLVVVRPRDLPAALLSDASASTNQPTATKVLKVKGVALCEHAVECLRKGYTLLLVKGNLIQIQLPHQRRYTMLIAGLLFREGEPQRASEEEAAAAGSRRKQERPDNLSFIIAEQAQRRKRFTGVHQDYIHSTEPGQRFNDGMYEFCPHDIFRYVPGEW